MSWRTDRLNKFLTLSALCLILSEPVWARTPYSNAEMSAAATSDEIKIEELRSQEVKQIRIALGRRIANNRRADLYFRLAEIYLEAYHQSYIIEGRVHDKRLEAKENDPGIDHSHSRPDLLNGIAASQAILKLRIPFSRMDQVIYFLAFNYTELGDKKQGLKYYEMIVQKFPSSPFVTEAYSSLAEESYDAAQYRKALGYFQAATQKANADAMPRLYHKMAWCYYRIKQYDQAISTMKTAVARSQTSGEKFLSIREEALRDMAMFMTESGRVDEAISYFQQTVGDKSFYPKLLERLGKQYERNVEPAKATQVYESLLKTNPESEEAFRVLVKLIDLDLRRSRFREAIARLKDYRLIKSDENETQVAAQNLRAMIRRTATEHHETFRKKADRPALEIAELYYGAYLEKFLAQDDPHKETREIQMYLAEVKRELGKSKEASELYRKVVDSRDPRYAKEAGALWTSSLSEAIKKSGDNTKAQEPSALEQEYVSAADQLQDALGDTAEGREAALRAAQVEAGYSGTRKDSIKRIKKILDRNPETPQSLTAARLWLQLTVEKLKTDPKDADDDIKDLISDFRKNQALMSADQKIGKGKLAAAMSEQELRLKVGMIARLEKDKDYAAAAQGYESFAQETPDREAAERAYSSAVATYLKVSDTVGVDRVTANWLKRYPKSPKALEYHHLAATQYLIIGKFEQAAKLFEKTGNEAGDVIANETAARIYDGLGDLANSRTNHLRFIGSATASAKERGLAMIALAKSDDSLGNDSTAIQLYKQCMSTLPEFEAECGVNLSAIYMRLKNFEEASSVLKKVSAMGSVGNSKKHIEAPSFYVAYARYKLAEQVERSQSFETLSMPEEHLKRAMSQRLAFIELISRNYMSVVDAGGPWAVAALDRLARAALEFAREVDQIAPATKLSEKGAEQFKRNLAAVSGPLRRKAIDTWLDAYRKAEAAEVLSPALPELADQLADSGVKTPARAQGFHGHFILAGIAPDGGESGASEALEKVRERLMKNPQDVNAWIDYGNLLMGAKKPILARIAYDRALQLSPQNATALNNHAVLLLNLEAGGEDNWAVAGEALAMFQSAARQDELFIAAKLNRALLLNYYRLFDKAHALWDQVLVKRQASDVYDGLAVSEQGIGNQKAAEAAFEKATELGAASSRFSILFHKAARAKINGSQGCASTLSEINMGELSATEKSSVDRLLRACGGNAK